MQQINGVEVFLFEMSFFKLRIWDKNVCKSNSMPGLELGSYTRAALHVDTANKLPGNIFA